MRTRWSRLASSDYGVTTVLLCIPLSILLGGILQPCATRAAFGNLSPEMRHKAKYLIDKLRSDNDTEDIALPPEERYLKPKIDATALLHDLGDEIQPKYISVFNPNVTQRNASPEHKNRQKGGGTRHKTLKDLLGGRMNYLPRDDPEFRRRLKKFLRNHSQCKVARYWSDLGERYFPRYVRKGYCASSNTSCSIPPGMTCLPGKRKELRLMRWTCHTSRLIKHTQVGSEEADEGFDVENMRCRWRKVLYPVLEECTCRCSRSDADSGD